jgi:hypothetical protein
MDHEIKDNQEQEHIPEAKKVAKKSTSSRRRKGRVLWWLFLLILLFIAFLYVQQWLLDMEAEAMIYAQQTVNAADPPVEPESEQVEKVLPTSTPLPTLTATLAPPTATFDPLLQHTQTVAAQLTNVASFQETQPAQ